MGKSYLLLLAIAFFAPSRIGAGVAPIESTQNPHLEEVCAANLIQLQLTKRLEQLVPFFEANAVTGFINSTRGSYFEIDTRENQIVMSFLTSGLFDLFLIQRSGPIQFCDDRKRLVVKGINRTEEIRIENDALILGDGGPKKTFIKGEKPDLLKRLSAKN